MNATAFALVLASAVLHVSWNALMRAHREERLFSWYLSLAGMVVLLPIVGWRATHGGLALAPDVLLCAALSGVLETIAFLALNAGYRAGELALIYPLSRGLAPVLGAAAGAVHDSERIAAQSLAAIGVIVAGASWLALQRPERAAEQAPRARSVLCALLCAAAVAGYHLVDRAALTHPSRPDEGSYFAAMHAAIVGVMTLWFAARGELSRGALARLRPLAGRALLGGTIMQAGYWLVLLALRQGASSVVVALRNIGIPLSLLAGTLLLKERASPRQVAAALLLTAGVVLLAAT